MPYAAIAELMGLRGIRVETEEAVGPAWDAALRADRPMVLDMVTDPNVAPLPPHITLKQAYTFMHSIATGEPEVGSVLKNTAKELIGSLLPGRR